MPDVMTTIEAAEYAGIAYSSMAQALREGRVEGWQSGATWLTTKDAVNAALDAGRIRPRKKGEEK